MGKTLAMPGMDSLDRDTMFIHTKGQFMIYEGQRTATGLTYQLGSKWGRDSGGEYSRGEQKCGEVKT